MLAAQAALRAAGCEDSSCIAMLVPISMQQADVPLQQAGNSYGGVPSDGRYSGANMMVAGQSSTGMMVAGQSSTGMGQGQVGGGGMGGVMHAAWQPQQQQVFGNAGHGAAGPNNLQQLMPVQQQELSLQQQMSFLGL
jgi:hypothetical protein